MNNNTKINQVLTTVTLLLHTLSKRMHIEVTKSTEKQGNPTKVKVTGVREEALTKKGH